MVWFAIAVEGVAIALLCAWIAKLSRSQKAAREESPDGKQETIFTLYQHIEEMLDSFEEYVGEMHAGLDEKREELLELSRQARAVYLQALEAKPPVVPPEPEPVEPIPIPQFVKPPKKEAGKSRLSDKDKEALGRFVTKPQKVRFLMSRGLSLEEVAQKAVCV